MTGARSDTARRRQTRTAAAARGLWGLTCLLRPGDVVRAAGGGRDGTSMTFVRVLGARELVQAAATAAFPSPRTVRIGVAVDLLHALSMCGLAVVDSRRRLPALVNTATATGWAVLAHRVRPITTT